VSTATFLNLPAEKRERILNAAIEEFGRRNFAEGNLANIVRGAGISRGSLYQYFKTKDDLYVYLFETLRAERAEYVKPAFLLYKKEPFLRFFEEFYMRDSEYLIKHPSHIELGQKLYSGGDNTSRGLIKRIQSRYNEWFLTGVDFDKDRGLIDRSVDSTVLADLCTHFVTDVFIFQSMHTQFSLANIRDYCKKTVGIIEHGVTACRAV